MAEIRRVRSSREIMGVDDFVGAEWDAGYIPAGAAFRRCRVTVRKDTDDCWTVYAVGFKGNEQLVKRDIFPFPCETCAKAFALCVVFGDRYAECETHGQNGFHEGDTFAGRFAALCCLLGIDTVAYSTLSAGATHRLAWIVRLISDGQLTWQRVIRAWEVAEQFMLERTLSLEGAISTFYAEAMKVEVAR